MAHFLVWCCHLWKRVSTTRAYLRRNKSMQTKLKYITPGRLLYKMTAPLNTSADRLDVRLRYLSAFPRTSAPNYGLLDVTGNMHHTWQHFFMDILCCYTFCPQKPHNATLFCRGTHIHGRRHLVTGAPSLQSCAHRSLHITIKLDSAAN